LLRNNHALHKVHVCWLGKWLLFSSWYGSLCEGSIGSAVADISSSAAQFG
jgi:hypothetical protein